MLSRIFKKDLQDWWHEQVEQFISQQVQLCHKSVKRVMEEVLHVKPTSD